MGIENYNDELLEQLAQHGNGWYRYLSDVNQARATFSRDSWLPLSIPFADQTRRPGALEPCGRRALAAGGLREPHHLRPVLHPGPQGVC